MNIFTGAVLRDSSFIYNIFNGVVGLLVGGGTECFFQMVDVIEMWHTYIGSCWNQTSTACFLSAVAFSKTVAELLNLGAL